MTQPQQPQPYYAQPYTGTFGPTPPPPPAPSHRRHNLNTLIAAAVLLGAALITLIVLLTTGSSERPLKVSFGLTDSDGGVTCEDGGSGGYSDIAPGMPLTVRDQDGKLIGSGSLPDKGEDYAPVGCIWTLTVVVPDDAEQYAVEGGHRGEVTYSRDKLEEEDWHVVIGIGS